MSKYLVAVYNNTEETIRFVNFEDQANNQTLPPQSMFTTANHFNIPDNSNSEKYFPTHHMELQQDDNGTIFSFWDNDNEGYTLYYCEGTDYPNSSLMNGYNPSGNKIDVAIVLTGSSGNYKITSCQAQALV